MRVQSYQVVFIPCRFEKGALDMKRGSSPSTIRRETGISNSESVPQPLAESGGIGEASVHRGNADQCAGHSDWWPSLALTTSTGLRVTAEFSATTASTNSCFRPRVSANAG